MTRQEIEQQYEVSDGRIRSLGKFQSEAIYVPYFWDAFMNGGADEDADGSLFFLVTPEDREQFPELTDVYGIVLSENNSGFVDSYRCDTQEEYDRCLKNCEEMDAANSEME